MIESLSADASTLGSRPGSTSVVSTKQTPSRYRPDISAAVATATVVFPTPPCPTTVTKRQRFSRTLNTLIASARPITGVSRTARWLVGAETVPDLDRPSLLDLAPTKR